MSSISFYIPATGKILGQLTADPQSIEITKEAPFHAWVDGLWDADSHYVLAGEVIPRPEMNLIIHGMHVANLPVPCIININGVVYPCNDGAADLDLYYPGTYQVKVIAWPYINKEFEIENPAS